MCTPSVLSCLCNPIIFSTTSDPSFLFTSFRLSFNSVLESYWAIIASPSCHDQSISVQTHFSKAICHPWYLCTSHVFGSYAWECSLHHLSAHPLQDWRCPQMHFFCSIETEFWGFWQQNPFMYWPTQFNYYFRDSCPKVWGSTATLASTKQVLKSYCDVFHWGIFVGCSDFLYQVFKWIQKHFSRSRT